MKFFAPILALFLALVATQVNAATPGVGMTFPISADQKGEKFDGTLMIKEFRASSDGQGIVALSVLSGTVTKGGSIRTIVADIAVPVKKVYSDSGTTAAAAVIAQATCPILHLDLGPIDLTLLGLNINISEIVIDITATQGGGLLGDLLCAIANLLSSGPLNTILTQLIGLLNQLLGALG